MIAVDTSALIAIILKEPSAADCAAILQRESRIVMSAATVAECLIVALRRGIETEMGSLLRALGIEIAPVTFETAIRVGEAYRRWGKGRHRAALNLGDCFSYDVAKGLNCPLLFAGEDFRLTDITPAL